MPTKRVTASNRLRDYLSQAGAPSKSEFARRIGMSHSYVSQLCGDAAPWPSRATMQRIVEETNGAVTANDFVNLTQFIGTGGRKKAA